MKTNSRPLFAALLLPVIAACAQAPDAAGLQAAPPPMIAGECNAAAAQFTVGRQADAQLQAEAQAKSGARTVRVLRPGDMATMEFSLQRLNLDVDATGKVLAARCG
ncbi:MAG: I78 family peptidase inhibitor [Ramlibacter sp.]